MRIIIISQWFEPEPIFKGLPFARELIKRGHSVQVLTGFPNYPGGKLYPGYKVKFLQIENMEGARVIRLPLFPSHDQSGKKRILNYISFAMSLFFMAPWLVRQADVVYVYHPPATVAAGALALKWFRRIPFVYDIQDLWPETLEATGMVGSKWIFRAVSWWCNLVYKQAKHITVLSPGFKRALVERRVPQEKVSVIYNWCDEDQIKIVDRAIAAEAEPAMRGCFNVVFAGTMGKAQALEAVLYAAMWLHEELPAVQFVFVGGGVEVERLKAFTREKHIENVIFLPRRPFSEIGTVLAMADVLLVHLKDDPLFEITLPSKTQAYMAVGRPILMAVRGDSATLVEHAGAGLTCEPEDAASIADAVRTLYKMPREEREAMGQAGLKFYRERLSLAVGTERFENVFYAASYKEPKPIEPEEYE
ncbi:MAG: glycosyltransferase family 4 protein [Armatimonadetes bacterium]|nr:glycosyltransferase family 4 protein [Armatimonadota bacterium]